MAIEIPGTDVGVEVAAADLSTHQYKFVKLTSTGWALATTGDTPDGVLQNKPTAGQIANVVTGGVSKFVASAAIAKGADVAAFTNGRGRTAVATDHAIGRCLVAAGADGEIGSIMLGYRRLTT